MKALGEMYTDMDNFFKLGQAAYLKGKSADELPSSAVADDDIDEWFSGWCYAKTIENNQKLIDKPKL